jgi:hypothetical protein
VPITQTEEQEITERLHNLGHLHDWTSIRL